MTEAERAFLEATLPHLDAVHAVARRLVADRGAAEDLVQETYLRAFAAFASHRGESTRAWLCAICLNAARAEWRRRARRVQEVPLGEPGAGPGESSAGARATSREDVVAAVEGRLDREAVARALAQLPEEQRLAIVLMDIGGSTAREVAAITGAPRGTVLARVHRGRRKLATLLAAEGATRDLP